MSRSQKLLEIIGADIRQDCDDYLRLRELIQELYRCLAQRDASRVEQLNQQIAALIDAADGRATRRSKILSAFRLEQGPAGMQKLLASYPQSQRDSLQSAWQQLGELAAECKRLNARNGKLLAAQHDILNQLLGGGEAQLYTPQPY